MAFLSIIIAAHNAEDTLHATLESLQNAIGSAGDAVEIIIFNDSSDDGTQDIIEAWLPKLPHATTRCVWITVTWVGSETVLLRWHQGTILRCWTAMTG